MQAQMTRRDKLRIAALLEDSLNANLDALDTMLEAYQIAHSAFTYTENDVDPATLALGVQAQALGVRTIAIWLQSISQETSVRYHNLGVGALARTQQLMDSYGIVIPDVMTL